VNRKLNFYAWVMSVMVILRHERFQLYRQKSFRFFLDFLKRCWCNNVTTLPKRFLAEIFGDVHIIGFYFLTGRKI